MSKKFILGISLMLAAGTCWHSANAVPAKPGLMKVTCADGTALNVRLMGDEHHHFYLSEDGYLLVNDNDTYYYGNVDAEGNLIKSDIRATAPAQRTEAARNYLSRISMSEVYERLSSRSAKAHAEAFETKQTGLAMTRSSSHKGNGPQRGPGLFAESNFPAKGEQKAIVILVEYQDTKMSTTYDAHDYFNRMLNEEGFNDYGGTGSARDFFIQNSNGQFMPEFDLYGPITLSKNMSYYGGNNWNGDDQHPEEMVIEACQQLDDEVDFTQYDRDGDGYIDNVFVFYAGRGEASGGASNTVWPHAWNVTAATYTPYIFDGVRLDRYACSNEWEGGRPDGVGTFVHEFSHVMGLPDLYATSYTSAFTPGSWSALDYGPYNNDGCTPPNYGAFERYALEWMEPATIDGPMTAALPAIDSNIAGIIPTSDPNEFFLVENRQQTGWDSYIPGHGMLIWHVDYDSYTWARNTVNNSASHQYVDIEEADNTRSEYSRDGDAFPGTANVTSFTDDTTPSMKTWGGQGLNLPITDIAETTDGLITFNVSGGGTEMTPAVALEPLNIEDESFEANWQAEEGMRYLLTVWEEDIDTGERTVLPDYNSINVGTTDRYTVSGLEAAHKYIYSVCATLGLQSASPSNEIEVITGAPTLRRYAVEALDATEVTSDSFTASWTPIELANDYLLTVYQKDFTPIEVHEGFDNGVEKLPEGWTSSSRSGYENDPYSGESKPSLRLGRSGDYLKLTYEDFVHGLKFWHRGNSTSPEDLIKVYATTANGSRSTLEEIPVVKTAGGAIVEIDSMPENTVAVEISFVRATDKGSLAIDDVTVTHGAVISDIVLENYDGIPTGDVSSYKVIGLKPDQEYFYCVVATDGTLFSRKSQEISVKTADNNTENSVNATAADKVSIRISGNAIDVRSDGAIMIADVAGRVVAAGRDAMTAAMTVPGIYIVKTEKATKKVVVK